MSDRPTNPVPEVSLRRRVNDVLEGSLPDVRLHIRHDVSWIETDDPEAVRDVLGYMVGRVRNCRGRIYVEHRRASLVSGRATLFQVPTGSLPRICERLAASGYTFEIADHRSFAPNAWPVQTTPYELRGYDYRIHEALVANPGGGVVEAPRGRRRIEALAVLMLTYPSARIFVVFSRSEDCCLFERTLLPRFGTAVKAVAGVNWRSEARVNLGTYAALVGANPVEVEMIVFEDALEGIGKRGLDLRRPFSNHLKFAFLGPSARVDRYERLAMEAAIGPQIFSQPPRRRTGTPRVIFATMRGSEGERPSGDLRERARQVRTNEVRNDVLASIARGVAELNVQALTRYDVALPNEPRFSNPQHPRTVAVLVDSPDHARRLQRRLRDWTVLDARSATPTTTAAPSWTDWTTPSRAIVTSVWANERPSFRPDVLVVASGGDFAVLPKSLFAPGAETLVIDLDGALPDYADAAARRRRGYELLGATLSNASVADSEPSRRSPRRHP